MHIFLESCRVTNVNANLGVKEILQGCKGHSAPPPIPSRWRRAKQRPRGGAEHRLGHFGTSRSNFETSLRLLTVKVSLCPTLLKPTVASRMDAKAPTCERPGTRLRSGWKRRVAKVSRPRSELSRPFLLMSGYVFVNAKACDACRHRKIRCNGVRPICLQCRTSGADCHYSDHQPTDQTFRPLSESVVRGQEPLRDQDYSHTHEEPAETSRKRTSPPDGSAVGTMVVEDTGELRYFGMSNDTPARWNQLT